MVGPVLGRDGEGVAIASATSEARCLYASIAARLTRSSSQSGKHQRRFSTARSSFERFIGRRANPPARARMNAMFEPTGNTPSAPTAPRIAA